MAFRAISRREMIGGAFSALGLSLFPLPGAGAAGRTISGADFGQYRSFLLNGQSHRKWREMSNRHALQELRQVPTGDCRWARFCRQGHGGRDFETAIRINRLVNAMPYRSEGEGADVWKTPREFANGGGGDCEDFAIAKYYLMRRAGWTDDELTLMVAFMRKTPRTAHAITVFRDGDCLYVMDNLNKNILKFRDISIRKPIYLINDERYIGFV